MKIFRSSAFLFSALIFANGAAAQTDTTRLEAVVVTADRLASSIATATAAVSRIAGTTIASHPLRTVADVLRLAPGTALVDFDGLGYDPQIMLRGFYGGGEAEYVLLLLDGRPLNVFETGRATWDQIPLSAIESVEIVRGGSSAAWGDAALAGVINLRTRKSLAPQFNGTVEAGSFGEVRASAQSSSRLFNKAFSAFGKYEAADGYRAHAERTTGALGATLGLIERDFERLSFTTSHDIRSVDDPGPLSGDALSISREASSPFFRFDNNEERTHRAGLDYTSSLPGSAWYTAQLNAEFRRSDRVRTLVLSPDFADTKERDLRTSRISGSLQIALDGLIMTGADDLLVGVDFASGSLRSSYYTFTQGDDDAYQNATAARGDEDARGEGSRSQAAAFAVYGLDVTTALRFTLGTRLDWLQDKFDALDPSDEASHSATHVAFSPKFGMNWQYVGGASSRTTGHLYANVGRSFKSPTQEQLFDQRGIPVPFPPFSITFANTALNPQFGTSYEAGIYQSIDLNGDDISLDVTVSGYQIDLKDELDFDISTFRYENIGRSRHRGIETGVTLHAPGSLRVFGNYTMQAPRSRSGDNAGKYLKAIPRHFVVAGASAGGSNGLMGSATITSASRIFLDDANESTLDPWNRVDVRAGYGFSGMRIFVDIVNAFDAEYSSTGFPDPSGSPTVYYHPAAGRSFRIGISRGG